MTYGEALMYHVEYPPEKCGYCIFRHHVAPMNLLLHVKEMSCYFKAYPVTLETEGCSPEFFTKELLKIL